MTEEPRMLTGNRTHRRTCPCGWEGAYTTTGYADKALRGHDCAADHQPRGCHLNHPHGTPAHYQHCGCRCWPCRRATLDAITTSHRRRAYGRCTFVDANPARHHVLALQASGLGIPRIADLADISPSTLLRLTIGKTRHGDRQYTRRLDRNIAERLLNLAWNPADGGPSVDGAPTRRRLRALVAAGWWPALLAREADWDMAHLDRILRGVAKHARVRPATARHIHTLYGRLAAAPAPGGPYAARARQRARRDGWAPPLRVRGRVVTGTALETPDQQEAA